MIAWGESSASEHWNGVDLDRLPPLPPSPTKSFGSGSGSGKKHRYQRGRKVSLPPVHVERNDPFVAKEEEKEHSPTRRKVPPHLGSLKINVSPNPGGDDPKSLVGHQIQSIHRSAQHPTLFLNLNNGMRYQVLVDGYQPSSPPFTDTTNSRTELEMDDFLERLFPPPGQTAIFEAESYLTIKECARITLCDKAFSLSSSSSLPPQTPTTPFLGQMSGSNRFDQKHKSLAFKFIGIDGWHTISARFTNDNSRSYPDVYVKLLPPPSPKKRGRKDSWPGSNGSTAGSWRSWKSEESTSVTSVEEERAGDEEKMEVVS